MKTISLLLVGLFATLSVLAQTLSSATITVKGTRTDRIVLDGVTYDVGNNIPVVVANLQPGQHTLQLIRPNHVNDANDTRSFFVRSGYDIQITVNNNGSISLKEIKIKPGTGQYRTPMPDAEFNVLYNNILKEWRNAARTTAVTNAISNTNNYFTTAQARQLIQLVNSQSNRLKLAKSVYPKITDAANFTQVYDLLNSQAARNDIALFVNNYNLNNPGHIGNVNTGLAMSDADFRVLYEEVQDDFGQASKVYTIGVYFSNPSHVFSSSQVRQLLTLVSGESDRLRLSKAGYARVADPTNYYNQVYTLLNSQSSRNDLAAYVRSYDVNNPGSATAMTTARFNILYREAQQKYPVSARVTYLSDLFANPANFYTTNQARQFVQLVTDETNRLYLAKLSYRGVTDKNNFVRMNDILGRQSSRDELAIHVNNFNNGIGDPPVIVDIAMPETEFNALYRDVENRWGLGAKMSALTNIFNNANYNFSTAQAKRLIQLVSSETNRLELAKSSYDNIVDPANFTSLYDVLASQSSRDQLAAYVRSYSSDAGYTDTPMSETSYNALYNDIANDWGLFVKMSRLTDVFNSTTNYFTTAQAKKLIELVSSESNRLQLAKSSFDNITDPQNFRLIYDVLASQSSRNELAAYVNDHTYKG
jgi:hypothetical protein